MKKSVEAASVNKDPAVNTGVDLNKRIEEYLDGGAATLKNVQSTLRRNGSFTVLYLYELLKKNQNVKFITDLPDTPISRVMVKRA